MATKQYGLRLSLGGAPCTPHRLPDVPGFFFPDVAVPVGGPDDPISLDDARRYDAQEGVPLELVEVTTAEAKKGRLRLAGALDDAKGALANPPDEMAGNEPDQHNDAIDAVKAAETPKED